MREFLINLLGEYTPQTYTQYVLVDDTWLAQDIIPSGVAGVDWLYIITAVAFLLSVYCVLRCLGGLICKIS